MKMQKAITCWILICLFISQSSYAFALQNNSQEQPPCSMTDMMLAVGAQAAETMHAMVMDGSAKHTNNEIKQSMDCCDSSFDIACCESSECGCQYSSLSSVFVLSNTDKTQAIKPAFKLQLDKPSTISSSIVPPLRPPIQNLS